MFLDERLRECVSILFVDDIHANVIKRMAIGSVFFVMKSLTGEDEPEEAIGNHVDNAHEYFTAYAVTACHVIQEFAANAPIYIRINKRDGTSYDHPTDPDDWIKDVPNDIAIFELIDGNIPLSKIDIALRALAFQTLASDNYMDSIPVRAGYEVFFLGLFAGHPGKGRAQPIIRFGNISLMRHDKIDAYLSHADALMGRITEIDAYLVEARSWGGQSGSPVLFYHPPLKADIEPLWIRFQLPIVLGVTHGQYERESQLIGNTPLVSAGIAMVIPAIRIRELIMSKDLQDKRAAALIEAKKTPSKDAPMPRAASLKQEEGIGEDGFLDALKRASLKLSEPESEKTQTSE